jgi:phospholipase C
MRFRVAIFSLPLMMTAGCINPASHSIPKPFPTQFKNVVIIFQENRTPDNLFHFLTPACPLPQSSDALHACIPVNVTNSCYDISPCGISNQSGAPQVVTLTPLPIVGPVQPDHSHWGFENMCDPGPVGMQCRNDGAWLTSTPAGSSYTYVDNAAVTNSDGSSGHLLDPYLTLAKQYGWANFMFQTNQGPSYPAHQFIFTGTAAPTAEDDANSTFVSENFNTAYAGCLAAEGDYSWLVSPAVSNPDPACIATADGSVSECPLYNTALVYPTNPVGTFCFSHRSMADLLEPQSINWKYYAANPDSIWTAPDSIQSICQPAFVDPSGNPNSKLKCTGNEWDAHVDIKRRGADILQDIANCSMAQVSWVTPDGLWSDHAGFDDAYGPSWAATVINAIGNNPTCPSGTPGAGENYWQDTAIILTWDDWGGWTDSQPPPFRSNLPCNPTDCQGDYQYGFRVPLVVVSAYTPAGYIDNALYDFGSILRFVEGVNHLGEGSLGFADQRSKTDLRNFFSLQMPRAYQAIPTQKDASFFLNAPGPAIDPDDD